MYLNHPEAHIKTQKNLVKISLVFSNRFDQMNTSKDG